MKRICQISKYYFPITGGQQVYIDALNNVLRNEWTDIDVLQPHMYQITPPPNIFYTKPIPFFYRFQRLIEKLDWFLFNIELFRKKRFLRQYDVLISHYSFHLPSLKWHPNIIVVSHGVLWSVKQKNYFDRFLKKTDFGLQKRSANITIVANDTDFIRRIGIDVPIAAKPFAELSKNIWFIPNCIDTKIFCPDNSIQKEKVILLPRNIREDRGIELAIRSFILFQDQNKDYKLLVAGGPTRGTYFEKCKAIVDAAGIEDKVVFLGFVDQNSLLSLYRKAMLTLVPSLEKEGTSLSALESMACGTPVISSAVGGLIDLPCVHAELNPEHFSECMIDVIKNWEKYSQIQRERVITTFNLENWRDAWEKVVSQKLNYEN